MSIVADADDRRATFCDQFGDTGGTATIPSRHAVDFVHDQNLSLFVLTLAREIQGPSVYEFCHPFHITLGPFHTGIALHNFETHCFGHHDCRTGFANPWRAAHKTTTILGVLAIVRLQVVFSSQKE